MAQQTDLPPVPISAPIVDDTDRTTTVWAEWFRKLSNVSDRTATGGYLKLPGGIIVQWGETASVASGATPTVTFPLAFPTACLQVLAGVRNNSAIGTGVTGHWGTDTYSTTGFRLNNRTVVAYVFNWIAIGH